MNDSRQVFQGGGSVPTSEEELQRALCDPYLFGYYYPCVCMALIIEFTVPVSKFALCHTLNRSRHYI